MSFLRRYGFRLLLLAVFLCTWSWAAWQPLHPDDWLLENYLVFFWLPVLLVTARVFRLSDVSYGCITLFMCLHVLGSHYTYAEVPFGYTLQEWIGADRNMYDRLVHFCKRGRRKPGSSGRRSEKWRVVGSSGAGRQASA